MKTVLSVLFLFLQCTLRAQETGMHEEEEDYLLERQAGNNNPVNINDDRWLLRENFRRSPLNLNLATLEQLGMLLVLSDAQLINLISYRRLIGRLESIYELQAVPGWDRETIRKILPYVTVSSALTGPIPLRKRWGEGQYSLLSRFGLKEKNSGGEELDSVDRNSYIGNNQYLLFRFRYRYRNLLQYGMTIEKDPGEKLQPFQRSGSGFHSFHLFISDMGWLQSLALGDFIINMGQGLIHWQGNEIHKSGQALTVKRISPVLIPYQSAGEFRFHRGLGATFRNRNWQYTVFGSVRQLSASVRSADPEEPFIYSLNSSGYHRTSTEINNRNTVQQLATGMNIRYEKENIQLGFNSIYHHFSIPFRSTDALYDLYSANGKEHYNYSIDYSASVRNFHFFGELATDRNFSLAILQGLIFIPDQKAELSVIYRRIGEKYRAVSGNAFTESAEPSNEYGLFAAITIRPAAGWQLEAWADLFRFPWLRYRISMPSVGAEYGGKIKYQPNRRSTFVIQHSAGHKAADHRDTINVLPVWQMVKKESWRFQYQCRINYRWQLNSRAEVLHYVPLVTGKKERGLSVLAELTRTLSPALMVHVRCHWYQTDSYNTRIYTTEKIALHYVSVPVYEGKGWRVYCMMKSELSSLMKRDPKKYRCTVWFRMGYQVRMATDYHVQLIMETR